MKKLFLLSLFILYLDITYGQLINRDTLKEEMNAFFKEIDSGCCVMYRNIITDEMVADLGLIVSHPGFWGISDIGKSEHLMFIDENSIYFINMKRPLKDIISDFANLQEVSPFFSNDTIYQKCKQEIIRIHKYNYYFDNGNHRTAIPEYNPNYWCIDSVKEVTKWIWDWSDEF